MKRGCQVIFGLQYIKTVGVFDYIQDYIAFDWNPGFLPSDSSANHFAAGKLCTIANYSTSLMYISTVNAHTCCTQQAEISRSHWQGTYGTE